MSSTCGISHKDLKGETKREEEESGSMWTLWFTSSQKHRGWIRRVLIFCPDQLPGPAKILLCSTTCPSPYLICKTLPCQALMQLIGSSQELCCCFSQIIQPWNSHHGKTMAIQLSLEMQLSRQYSHESSGMNNYNWVPIQLCHKPGISL